MKATTLFFWLLGLTNAFALHYEFGQNVTISQPVNGNLYVTGGTIIINAPIRGDLIALGGTITINDSVTNDVLLAGGTVVLNGYVGDDIRCAGGSIQLLRSVAGDAVLAGGTLTIDRNSNIGGGLLSVGGTTTLNGQVGQEAMIAFGNLRFEGTVNGDLTCRGGDATLNGRANGRSVLTVDELVIGPKAHFGLDVRYWNRMGTVAFGNSVQGHKVLFDSSLAPDNGRNGSQFAILGVLWYLGMALLMIFLIQYLFSRSMKEAGQLAATNTLQSGLIGLLFFIVVPVIAVAAYVSVIGVAIGIILTFGYIAAMLLAPVITAVVLANMLQPHQVNRSWNTGRLVFTALGVFIGLQVIWIVPIIGWLLLTLFISVAFGAILLTIQWRGRQSGRIIFGQPQPIQPGG